jgi:hypothetical protein
MRTFENYTAPSIEIVLIADDVVRTSLGLEEGELPVQPWCG